MTNILKNDNQFIQKSQQFCLYYKTPPPWWQTFTGT